MDKARARSLVRDTFEHGFNRGRYESFLRDLLNRFEEKPLKYQGAYIPDAFKDQVASLERIGTYQAPGGERIDLLIVHLTKHSTLARARTALRNYVAHHLKTRDAKDAALVAFVSPSEPSWRFSYVRMEYATVTDERGRVGTKTELTPARRLSYLVGEGESCHTAQSRFLDILQQTSHDPTVEELETAFSVEAVTREFFEQYKALFLNLEEQLDVLATDDKLVGSEFAARKIATADFAKKLMGQIVFLYFLQKKGWLGVAKGRAWGTGPRDFIRRLTRGEFGVHGNIFNDILEPLFYDTLATDRGPDAWCSRFKCRIPFLNGGLFEPLGGYDWITTDIVIPNVFFTNAEKTPAGDLGTGILDVFDRYNFTVNEAEPLEIEVAIDPEMLGKVFENLLEERERKSKGSFYTPREIVHYMCEESLINYLDNRVNRDGSAVERPQIEALIRGGEQAAYYEAARKDGTVSYTRRLPAAVEKHARAIDEALSAITVCDPAIGSGAFPVGMMTEIVRARTTLTPYFEDSTERTRYHFKRHAIQACLYGADLDPGAVEIAKLRLWLSLVVDEDDVQQIKPLPNLDYKIVAGNSLLGFPFRSERIHQIERLKADYFEETDHEKKHRLKREIDTELSQAFANSKRSLGYEVSFDFQIYFSEVFRTNKGFDVVIANPPYVRHEAITEMAPALRQRFTVAASRADLLIFFYEQGVNLLRPGGVLTLITSNKFYRAAYGSKLRPFLTDNLQIEILIDFGDAPVFEAVAYASILIGRKGGGVGDHQIRACSWRPENDFSSLQQTLTREGISLAQRDLAADGWRLESLVAINLLEKLRKKGTPLGEYVGGKFYYGIKTGLNEAYVLTREQRDQLIAEDRKSAKLIKPYLRGRDVKRWMIHHDDRYLIVFPHGFHAELKNYPAILRHLTGFQAKLKERGQCKTSRGNKDGGQHHWLELDNNPKVEYLTAFTKPKIIFGRFMNTPLYAFDDSGMFHNNALSFAPADSASLAAFLNNSAAWWFLLQVCTILQNGYIQAQNADNAAIPIPPASVADKAKLTKLAERAAEATQVGDNAIVARIEREIDKIIYRLFDLTSSEIAHIETTIAKTRGQSSEVEAGE